MGYTVTKKLSVSLCVFRAPLQIVFESQPVAFSADVAAGYAHRMRSSHIALLESLPISRWTMSGNDAGGRFWVARLNWREAA
jgi:hypothetical protein